MIVLRSAMLAAATALLLSACATGPDVTAQAPTAQTPQSSGQYRIGVDDQVQVNVWRNPDLSLSVPVRPDGMISVPLIGDVQAGGLTPTQVADEIRQKLDRFVREPQVTVIVTELRSHEFISRVRVTGAVQSPLSLPYRQGMTVLDAVLEAGGTTEFAAANRARLYRRAGDQTEVLEIDLRRILSQGELATNYGLMPGDIISVPERLF